MTALNIATQIPSSIVTLEQLVAWGALTLSRMYPDKSVLESETVRELSVQAGIFTSAEETTQLLLRLSLKLDPAYITDTRKLWMSVDELGSGNIPASFTSN